MTRMFLTIMDLEGTSLTDGDIEMPIVPIGTKLRFDDSISENVFFVRIISYDLHMTPTHDGRSKATHMHAYGELMDDRSHYELKKGTLDEALSFAAFNPASQANFPTKPKGSLIKKS